jgi:hypothetical protein
MAHIYLEAADARVARVELGRKLPAHVLRIEPEFLEVGGRRDADVVGEEVLNFLEEDAGAEKAALVRVVLEREIEVVRGPRLQPGVADVDRAAKHVGVAELGLVQVAFADRGIGDDLDEVGPAIRQRVRGAGLEVLRHVVGQVHARVEPVVGAAGAKSAFLPREPQFLDRADGAGIRTPDTLALGVAGEGAVGVANEGVCRLEDGTESVVGGRFVAHAREHVKPVAEQPGLHLRVAGGDGLLDVLGVGDEELLGGDALGGRHREQ